MPLYNKTEQFSKMMNDSQIKCVATKIFELDYSYAIIQLNSLGTDTNDQKTTTKLSVAVFNCVIMFYVFHISEIFNYLHSLLKIFNCPFYDHLEGN